MSWIMGSLGQIENIAVAIVVDKYLGRFISGKVTNKQMKTKLFKGMCTIKDVPINVEELNKFSDNYDWPVEFVGGYLGEVNISLSIKGSSCIKVNGANIIVRRKKNYESTSSLWNSMTSMTEEQVKQGSANVIFDGVKLIENMVDTIINNIEISFQNTVIRIEHTPDGSTTGVGVVVDIGLISFCQEKYTDPTKKIDAENSPRIKKVTVEDINLSTMEFYANPEPEKEEEHTEENDDEEEEEYSDAKDSTEEKEYMEENESTEDEKLNEVMIDDEEDEFEEKYHKIKFGQLSGSHEISIFHKESNECHNPELFVNISLGSFILFMSPRQFHILVELANSWTTPDIEIISKPPNPECTVKPMTDLDFQRLENEFQNQFQPVYGLTGLRGAQGWSGELDNDTEDVFLPVRSMLSSVDDVMSDLGSVMNSSLSSSMFTSATEFANRTSTPSTSRDKQVISISNLYIELKSVAFILLHENVLIRLDESEELLEPSSVQQMNETVQKFFKYINDSESVFTGIIKPVCAKEILDNSCTMNHLSFFANSISVEGEKKITNKIFSVSTDIKVEEVELSECLFNTPDKKPSITSILKLHKSTPLSFWMNNIDPDEVPEIYESSVVTVTLKRVQNIFKHPRKNASPRTVISAFIKNTEIDMDISIIDRIATLLHTSNLFIMNKLEWNVPIPPDHTSGLNSELPSTVVDEKTDITIRSSDLCIKLRFPIPNFKPENDPTIVPWWQKNIRDDFLLLLLNDATFQTTIQTNQAFGEYGIKTNSMDVYFMRYDRATPLHIAKLGFKDRYPSSAQDQIRLDVKIFPVEELDIEHQPEQEPVCEDPDDEFAKQTCNPSGPFSSKQVFHESDTLHSDEKKNQSTVLTIPGDKNEIDKFIQSTTACSRIVVEMFIPMVSLQFLCKSIYETIYNRINNDLLLWTPSAPEYKTNSPSFFPRLKKTYYPMCEDEMENSSSFFDDESDSLSEYTIGIKEQSEFVLNIQIAKGVLSLLTNVKDQSTNFIPGLKGEILCKLEDANVFIVSGYKGNENLSYVSVQVHGAQLFFCDIIPDIYGDYPLKDFGCMVDRHLKPIILNSERGMLVNARSMGGKRELFTVAVKIQAHHDTPHAKNAQISIGFNKGTLNHFMCREPNSWFSHLMDFFDVKDYPIPYYTMSQMSTEVHLHIWDCAIDYRPRYLPLRSVLTIGNFSITSNASCQSDGSTLNFIFEECELFMSVKAPPKNGIVSTLPVDLRKDYVNIIHVGMFEISLRTHEKNSDEPYIDLRTSNDIINIYTCSDSGKKMCDFLSYLVNDGDLSPILVPDPDVPELPRVVDTHHISYLTESQQERVETLLEDAMNDEVIDGVAVGSEVFPKCTYPEIEWLSDKPVDIDIFYFPEGRLVDDPLNTPTWFPTPVKRYTLCNMSIVWNMYGGNDFDPPESGRQKKNIQTSGTHRSGDERCSKDNRGNTRGGVNRNHDVHMEIHLKKIRFQHEIYPDGLTHASRQVFMISDVEILDRLESSQINKFLYQYISQALPKKSGSYMVMLKTLHLIPDPKIGRQECCLKLTVLPIKLNIDQDALLFMIKFFTELIHGVDELSETQAVPSANFHQPPIMNVSDDEDELEDNARKVVEENLIMLESRLDSNTSNSNISVSEVDDEESPIFFRDIIFTAEVPIRLDYQGKRVDMTHGPLPGLLMGLAHLSCTEIRLKRLRNRKGILGVDKLLNYLFQYWLNDLKTNQLPYIFGGIGPMHAFIQLFQGIKDLVWLPIAQYQKDGRIIRGLQRGATSFTSSTTMALLELTTRLIQYIQISAETAYDILSAGPSASSSRRRKGKKKRYYNRPQDLREGMTNAIMLLREGIGETADNLVQVASQEKEQKGYSGAVGGVIRQIPPTILRPIIVATEATGNVLGGVRNQFVPDARQENIQKWRRDDC